MSKTVTLRLTIPDPVEGVRYSLQDAKSVPVDAVTAGDGPLSLDAPVTLALDGRLTGAFIRREGPIRRFVYIAIGTAAGDHFGVWSRRAKIDIHDIPKELLEDGATLECTLPGRFDDGSPTCATVRPTGPWRRV